jgi:hypothetical protein
VHPASNEQRSPAARALDCNKTWVSFCGVYARMYWRLRWKLCTGHPESVYPYAVATPKCHVGHESCMAAGHRSRARARD